MKKEGRHSEKTGEPLIILFIIRKIKGEKRGPGANHNTGYPSRGPWLGSLNTFSGSQLPMTQILVPVSPANPWHPGTHAVNAPRYIQINISSSLKILGRERPRKQYENNKRELPEMNTFRLESPT